MKNIKKYLVILFLAISVVACSNSNQNEEKNNTSQSEKAIITLKDNDTKVDGDGVSVNKNVITIKKEGNYLVKGSLSDGQLVVDADEKNVKITFDSVSITNKTTAAIKVTAAKNTYLHMKEKTKNSITATNIQENAEVNAAIYSKDDLFIEGSGQLDIKATGLDGIGGSDDVSLTDTNVNITSDDDGIRGKDSISLTNVKLDMDVVNDGLKSTNTEDTKKGNITITSGTYNIKTTGSDDSSHKAIKAASTITIEDGNFTLNSTDDSIHANNIIIEGGVYTIESGDDGIHADAGLTINNGKITISKSYEGLEASELIINGGEHSITASDDGINAAGGSDTTTSQQENQQGPGPGGPDQFSSSTGTLTIKGGIVNVYAQGDGLDANGDITMTGGEVYIHGPSNGGNGSLDYDGTFTLSGGKLVGAGSSDMAVGPSDTSSQYTLMAYFTQQLQANTKISIYDSKGNEIDNFTAATNYDSFIYSSDKLVKNETYTIKVEDQEIDITLDSVVSSNRNINRGGPQDNRGGRPGF